MPRRGEVRGRGGGAVSRWGGGNSTASRLRVGGFTCLQTPQPTNEPPRRCSRCRPAVGRLRWSASSSLRASRRCSRFEDGHRGLREGLREFPAARWHSWAITRLMEAAIDAARAESVLPG